MPGGDRTGPRGQGPMTGRQLGYCTGNTRPSYTTPRNGQGFGRGGGRGFGRGYWGRGRGNRWYPPDPYYDQPTPQTPATTQDEKTYLETMIKTLENDLKSLQERLKNLTMDQK